MDKQYDGYVQYWSYSEHKIVNRYCGSPFLGHCTSDDLVDHFKQFMLDNELVPNYLLHLGMDGPNVNLAFQEKLSKYLRDNLDKSFLNLGTCSLHPVHTAFRRGITSMSCDLGQFFTDIHFFFKLSSARRAYGSRWAYGVVVSMFDFHRSDRGSNPGRGGKIS